MTQKASRLVFINAAIDLKKHKPLLDAMKENGVDMWVISNAGYEAGLAKRDELKKAQYRSSHKIISHKNVPARMDSDVYWHDVKRSCLQNFSDTWYGDMMYAGSIATFGDRQIMANAEKSGLKTLDIDNEDAIEKLVKFCSPTP